MAQMRALNRLSALAIEAARKGRARPGWHADGGGLWLRVGASGSASWVFRYTRGKRREIGLGSLQLVGLAAARQKAAGCRIDLGEGVAPVAARRRLDRPRMTFAACVDAYIEAKRGEWKSAKHLAQWRATLDTYAGPAFGALDVAEVDTARVLAALEPIWTRVPETASRLRGRIEAVLSWAAFREFRPAGDNPARWRGHLDQHLARKAKLAPVVHHAALPYAEMPAFMASLKDQPGVAALALQFAILTACRTGEVIGATWAEIDLAGKVWTIPAERMKAGKEHRVPLSGDALAILQGATPLAGGAGPVFPGGKAGKPLSNMAMLAVLARMKRPDLTVHGMRSTFRDWAGETTAHPREVIEHALAHQLKDKAEAAYQRGTLLQKRAALMADWAAFAAGAEITLEDLGAAT